MFLFNALAQQTHAQRILTTERLVENQQIRLMEDCGDELHTLQHALRQILAALVLRARQRHALEQPRHARGRIVSRQALQLRHVDEERPHLHSCGRRPVPQADSRCDPSPRARSLVRARTVHPSRENRIEIIPMHVVLPRTTSSHRAIPAQSSWTTFRCGLSSFEQCSMLNAQSFNADAFVGH
jgi:hypothetical protein